MRPVYSIKFLDLQLVTVLRFQVDISMIDDEAQLQEIAAKRRKSPESSSAARKAADHAPATSSKGPSTSSDSNQKRKTAPAKPAAAAASPARTSGRGIRRRRETTSEEDDEEEEEVYVPVSKRGRGATPAAPAAKAPTPAAKKPAAKVGVVFKRFPATAHQQVPLNHRLLDSALKIGPLISCWELDKFINCWNKSFRTLKS